MNNRRSILSLFKGLKKEGKSGFAMLIDPDSVLPEQMIELARHCEEAKVDFVFLGGSLMISNHVSACIKTFKKHSNIPIVLFPGSPAQVSPEADALLYLSLISGRNPDLLIGQHVISASAVKASQLEVISTGYMLIEGGRSTTVSYMSNSLPIPADKPDIALSTAWAGELQGKHLIYMDAGSGAKYPISEEMIKRVSAHIEIPLIVGGGITNPEKVYRNCQAGAQIVVVGNAIERDLSLLSDLSAAVKSAVY